MFIHLTWLKNNSSNSFGFRGTIPTPSTWPPSGGRLSKRALAKTFLQKKGIEITARIKQIGTAKTPEKIERLIEQTKVEGDSVGGIIECVIKGCPEGIGEPVFSKLQAQLAKAMMSIPAAKGFEYGEGFASATMKGSEHNDVYIFNTGDTSIGSVSVPAKSIKPVTNHSGGILGGISTGQDIVFRVAFKPIASISKPQQTVDKKGNPIELVNQGRHDICCVPRALPVVEAMTALVLADMITKSESPYGGFVHDLPVCRSEQSVVTCHNLQIANDWS